MREAHGELFADLDRGYLCSLVRKLPSPLYSGGEISRVVVLDATEEAMKTEVKVECEADPTFTVKAMVTAKSIADRKREVMKQYEEKKMEVTLASLERQCEIDIRLLDNEAEQLGRQPLTHPSPQTSLVQNIKKEGVVVKVEGVSAECRPSYRGAGGVDGTTGPSFLALRTPSPFASGSTIRPRFRTPHEVKSSFQIEKVLAQSLVRDSTTGIPLEFSSRDFRVFFLGVAPHTSSRQEDSASPGLSLSLAQPLLRAPGAGIPLLLLVTFEDFC